MSAPETTLHQGKNMGKGKSIDTLRKLATENNKLRSKKETSAKEKTGIKRHCLPSGRKI
ncbi:MAG TPA: hypothetical protein O0X39_00820 [Methanocorpusculum sp.]|nr:hypothetical protein [Methanocorpusculum sp.]